MIKLILVRRKGQTCDRFFVCDRRVTSSLGRKFVYRLTKGLSPLSDTCDDVELTSQRTRNRYEGQPVQLPEATANLTAYFYCLRGALDREPHAALVVDLASGLVLSINLPAFELLRMDIVGFQMIDFAADRVTYERISQQLQQSGNTRQTTLLYNADGDLIECKIKAEVAPHYSGWAIFRLNAG